jgi:general secretion pathway protein G
MAKSRTQKQTGFTIVELLIVIVVIAILAVISIIAYSGIQSRARASLVSSDLSNAVKSLKLYQVENGAYPADLASANLKASSGTAYQYTVNNTANPPTFCLTATNGTTSYKITEASTPEAGGCAGHGVGGVAAITNLSAYPSIEAGTSGWARQDTSGSVSSLARDTSQAYVGNASALYTYQTIGTNSSYPRWTVGGQASSQSAGNYTASVWTTGPSGGYGRLCLSLSGATQACGAPVILSPTQWRQVSVATTTASMGDIALYVQPVGSNGSTTTGTLGAYRVDAVMLTSGPGAYAYADGDSPSWVWNGTAHASTSTGPAQ